MKNNLRNVLALSFITFISIAVTLTLILVPNSNLDVNFTLFILPILSIVVVLTNAIYPHYKIEIKSQKEPKISAVSLIIVALFTIMQVLVLLSSLGYQIDVWKLSIVCLGFLVSLAGNYFPKAKQNDIFAIYNSWTIANKTIWRKTHRAAGYACFLGGLLIMLSALVSNDYNLWFAVGVLGLLIIFPTVFSMLYFRHKVKKNNG